MPRPKLDRDAVQIAFTKLHRRVYDMQQALALGTDRQVVVQIGRIAVVCREWLELPSTRRRRR